MVWRHGASVLYNFLQCRLGLKRVAPLPQPRRATSRLRAVEVVSIVTSSVSSTQVPKGDKATAAVYLVVAVCRVQHRDLRFLSAILVGHVEHPRVPFRGNASKP